MKKINTIEPIASKRSFRYLGSKANMWKYIYPCLVNKHYDNYYEPFLGSGCIGLSCVDMDIADNYYLSDLNPLFIDRWNLIRDDFGSIINDLVDIGKFIEDL